MTLLADLTRILPAAAGRIHSDVLMSEHTTFRIGGPADIYFEPASLDEVVRVVSYCRDTGISHTIIGNGSNILVSDLGIRGVVISIGEELSRIVQHNDQLTVLAGTPLSAIAAHAARSGLSGLEFASGIPGTLGGAILMNAGAYDHCMAEVVLATEFLDSRLAVQVISRDEHQFTYRKSYFSEKKFIIYQASIKLVPDDSQNIYKRMSELAQRRRAAQPLDLPSAGSAFKRPAGFYAGKLISDCGLKGCRIGDAQVSEKHAGFIVNLGRACAADVRELFGLIQDVVAERAGIRLEPEVRFVGEWPT